MHKLMLSTALVLPLMMGQAMAQDTTTPAPVDPATDAAQTEVPDSMNTQDAAEVAAETTEAEVAASGKVERQQAANELRIDWITNTTVNSPDGDAIGDINDVIVDAEAGTMKAAVIGVGGFLGIGEKQIAVPWGQLTINYDAQQITSDLTQEEAKAAPEYVFREQEAAPSAMDAPAPVSDATMTTAPLPGAPVTTDPAATTTTDPAMTGTDSATTTPPPVPPADTAETPATEPAEADAIVPVDGTTVAPADADMGMDTMDHGEGEMTEPAEAPAN